MDFDLLKPIILISFLIYASYSDLKSRTVPNNAIGLTFLLLLPFIVVGAYKTPLILYYTFIGVIIAMVLGYIMYCMKFGGADVKILILLALIYPFDFIIFITNAVLITILDMVVLSGIYRKNYFTNRIKIPFVPFILIGVVYGLWFGAIVG